MKIYCTTFCNFGHDVATGKPVGHECYVIPPKALTAEMSDDFDLAREIIAEHLPLRVHRGVRVQRTGNAR